MDKSLKGNRKMTHRPQGYPVEGDRRKLAISFEQDVFQRVCDEAEERGANVSDHVNWLLKRSWRFETELANIKEAEIRQAQAMRELERRHKAGGRQQWALK
jgi:hypothetical protein